MAGYTGTGWIDRLPTGPRNRMRSLVDQFMREHPQQGTRFIGRNVEANKSQGRDLSRMRRS